MQRHFPKPASTFEEVDMTVLENYEHGETSINSEDIEDLVFSDAEVDELSAKEEKKDPKNP
jgi:hypothetical protein